MRYANFCSFTEITTELSDHDCNAEGMRLFHRLMTAFGDSMFAKLSIRGSYYLHAQPQEYFLKRDHITGNLPLAEQNHIIKDNDFN